LLVNWPFGLTQQIQEETTMIGKIRIRRQSGISCVTDGKPVYVPEGARFVTSTESKLIATIATTQSAELGAGESEMVVEARCVDNLGDIVIGVTDHEFRPSFVSSDPSPGKPQEAFDWKMSNLTARPIETFHD
jgi:hypothetical protein